MVHQRLHFQINIWRLSFDGQEMEVCDANIQSQHTFIITPSVGSVLCTVLIHTRSYTDLE